MFLLHGMGRTSLSMIALDKALRENSYHTCNWNYNGFRKTINEIAEEFTILLKRFAEHPFVDQIHIVTHSLGGIITRRSLSKNWHSSKIHRIVMLAPPNQGVEIANLMSPFLAWLLIPLSELRPSPLGLLSTIAPVNCCEIGIITGSHDSIVSRSEAELLEAKSYKELSTNHTFIATDEQVIRQTLIFLREGLFSGAKERASAP